MHLQVRFSVTNASLFLYYVEMKVDLLMLCICRTLACTLNLEKNLTFMIDIARVCQLAQNDFIVLFSVG